LTQDLDIRFNTAFEKISIIEKTIASDDLLKLYAFNKQAKIGDTFIHDPNKNGLINGFKFNAWNQLNGMSQEKAKKEYIKLANSLLKK
jgi:diazepam-binding inhibitor (GABA receptor modulating acyl-CoA-binding protein)